MTFQPQPDEPARRDPSARDVVAPLARARELQLAGHYVAAEARYRAVLKLDPYQPQALLHLALLVWSLGRPVEALRHLRLALEADPDLPTAREHLSTLLRALGRA
ncbi:MAG: tetratricopeptide repeat protein [Planctomycetota bacterium]